MSYGDKYWNLHTYTFDFSSQVTLPQPILAFIDPADFEDAIRTAKLSMAEEGLARLDTKAVFIQ